MKKLETIMQSMTFDFFGNGKHKICPDKILQDKNNVLLDVRSKEKTKTLSFKLLFHDILIIEIPINEIPDRLNEIPKDKTIGIFCSSGVRAVIVYAYLLSLGYEKVKIVEGGYNLLIDEFKPGKLLKHISKN